MLDTMPMWTDEELREELADRTPFGPLPTPLRSLAATKTSHRWASLPGNWDVLNTRALWPSGNQWGIPDLPRAEFIPARLVAYNASRPELARAGTDSAVHFFLDDYRFETMWSQPSRSLLRVAKVGAALTPDFSLWRDMPRVMQIWQVYRSRWCGAWLAHHGIEVIPTVSWSTPDSYDFAFAGVSTGSVVAVSTVGIVRDREATAYFWAGYEAMVERVQPPVVLVYGSPQSRTLHGDVPVRWYPTRWEAR